MNKKFSTLVAALLVSGGSFAMVSQYMGSALSESPLAVAAAANLRATETITTGYSLASANFDDQKATVWTLAGGKLQTAEGYYLTAEAKLSDDADEALRDLSYDAEGHVYSDSKGHLLIGEEGVSFKAGDLSATDIPATLFKTATGYAQEAVGASSYVSYIGQEVYTYAKGDKALKLTEATGVKFSVNTTAASAGAFATAAANADKTVKVVSAEDGGAKFLKVVTENGTEYYVVAKSTTEVGYQAEEPKNADYVNSALTLHADGYVQLGAKSLLIENDYSIKLGDYNDGYGYFLYKDGGSVVTTLETGEYVLANMYKTGVTALGTYALAANIISVSLDGANVVYGDVASGITATGTATSFTLSNGVTYLAGATFGEKNSARNTYSLDTDGKIKCGSNYLVYNGTTLTTVATVEEGQTPLYLYSGTGTEPMTAATFEAGTVKVATRNATLRALSTVKVAQATAVTEDVTTTEPNENLIDLTAGASYYISDKASGKFLIVTKNGKDLDVSSTGELWKVSVVNAGAGKFYSFTNQYGQALAFNVSDADVVTYATDGKYSQFFVNEFGEILFETADDVYEVNITDNGITYKTYVQAEYAEAQQNKFTKAEVEEVNNTSDAVKLLNKTYGTGNGFGIMFKNMAITEDKVKDMALESNPFSDASLITAVVGQDLSSSLRTTSVARANLSGKMFLKVSGAYPLTEAQLVAKGANTPEKVANAQIDAFRASNFIAVDTVRYSSLVPDYNNQNNFFKYVTVSGASMLSQKGYVFDNAAVDADFGRSGALEGVTRRIENAAFTLEQIQGGTVTDAIQLVVDAYMPQNENGEKYGVKGHTEAVNDLYITIKNFNGKNYLGAGPEANAWDYVYVGMNNDVDYKTINGIVTLISRNYDTDGYVYASPYFEAGFLNTVLPKYVSTDKPEGQYLVTGGDKKNGRFQPFTFTNRESGAYMTINGLKKTDVADVYATADGDTIEIKAASTANEFVGYANYDANVLANTQYVLKVVSNAAGIKDIYIAEDHNKDHSLGLNADTLEAANFKLVKFERAANKAKYIDYGDTVFVNQNPYSYIAVDKKTKEEYYDVAEDRVVAFTYAIYNADNGEYLDVNTTSGVTKAEYYFCNPNKKYGKTEDKDIQRFIIKEKANGAVQLIPVNLHNSDFEGSVNSVPQKQQFTQKAFTKLYAGISDNKIYKNGAGIYQIADNDLFTIQQIGAPLYRTLDVTGNVRIYKEGMPNIALFAESADKALVSGQNLLGMEHKADADLNKTMFSFMVDTAYVDRANNYTPQYLLAIDATTTPGGKWCETHQSATCEHAVEIPGYVKGSYLVSLADSADAVAASQAHKNPYRYDGYNRLGFVKATHIGDALAIERGKAVNADTLSLKDGLTKASFALRIVDQATKSFALQNADGYVKWLNGVPVLVGNFDQAEVLNIEATENAATDNESIEAATVQVIAGKGVVTVQGAAGKVVTVANILGQTIANQVAASDNVTIAAPAGVLVVTVGGEATKVVVK